MAKTTNTSTTPEIPRRYKILGYAILLFGAALIATLIVSMVQGTKDAIAADEAMIETISEELDVEVINFNPRGYKEETFLDIRNSDGETLRCDFPEEFDGELYGCDPVTVVTNASAE